MANKTITVEGMNLTFPAAVENRCLEFSIQYNCGCPVTESETSHHPKIIHVRQHNHKGPCWVRRCQVYRAIHSLTYPCPRCIIEDIRDQTGTIIR
ncbi:hypothetical protein F4819DRAFT_126364 [Hypoxylon fuscum]|nr:hypothetical protein F4819DRAFT_126364 [Hypoxylon fuscum]